MRTIEKFNGKYSFWCPLNTEFWKELVKNSVCLETAQLKLSLSKHVKYLLLKQDG